MEYLGLEPPGSPWSLKSRGLAQGLILHEDGTNRLGIPVHVAQDSENSGFFEVDDSLIDHSEAALVEWQKQNEKPEPGVIPVVRLDARAVAAAKARREAESGARLDRVHDQAADDQQDPHQQVQSMDGAPGERGREGEEHGDPADGRQAVDPRRP